MSLAFLLNMFFFFFGLIVQIAQLYESLQFRGQNVTTETGFDSGFDLNLQPCMSNKPSVLTGTPAVLATGRPPAAAPTAAPSHPGILKKPTRT